MNGESTRFRTMWGRSLRWLTWLSGSVLVGLTVTALLVIPDLGPGGAVAVGGVALIALATTLLRQIRGYEVGPLDLYVLHLGWRLRVDLTGLQAVEVDPTAMRDAHMTFGSGRFGDFFRTFRNDRLGQFRAYATDRDHAVVLRFLEHTVVVSPADPPRMAALLRKHIRPPTTRDVAGP